MLRKAHISVDGRQQFDVSVAGYDHDKCSCWTFMCGINPSSWCMRASVRISVCMRRESMCVCMCIHGSQSRDQNNPAYRRQP